jgi:hypothetical protein
MLVWMTTLVPSSQKLTVPSKSWEVRPKQKFLGTYCVISPSVEQGKSSTSYMAVAEATGSEILQRLRQSDHSVCDGQGIVCKSQTCIGEIRARID